jgi:hypothetical protein
MKFLTMLVAVTLALGVAGLALAQDAAPTDTKAKGKPKVELPEAAAKTIATVFPKGTLGKTSIKNLGGVQVFVVDIKNDLPGAVVHVTADGILVMTEVDVTAKDLPESVTQAVKKAAEGAEIKGGVQAIASAEIKDGKVTKLDKEKTLFQLDLQKDTQKGSMTVAGDGTVVVEPKWKAAKPPKPSKTPATDAAPSAK